MFKNQEGAVLFTAFIISIILALLGTALWQFVILDARVEVIEEQLMQAYYIAKSGADAVIDWIQNDPAPPERSLMLNGLTSDLTKIDHESTGKFKVTVKQVGEAILVTSTGYVGKLSNTVNVKLSLLDAPFTFDKVLFIGNGLEANDEAITLSGGAKIKGPVYLGSGSIKFHNIDDNEITGSLYLSENTVVPSDKYKIGGMVEMSAKQPPQVPKLPEFPNPPVFSPTIPIPDAKDAEYIDFKQPIRLTEGSVKKLTVPSDNNLNFEVTSGKAVVEVNSLSGAGEITVSGLGHLTLVVNGDLNWSGNINGNGDSSKLTVIVKGTNVNLSQGDKSVSCTLYAPNIGHLSLGSSFKFNGELILPKASLTTNNETSINGSVYVGGQNISLGSSNTFSGLIYAPNATLNTNNGTNILGNVVVGHARLGGTALAGSLYALNENSSVEFEENRGLEPGFITKVYSRGSKFTLNSHIKGEIHLSNKEAELTMGGGSTFDGTVYSDGKKLDFGNNTKFSGFIYATNAEADIKVSGSSAIDGSIITAGKSVTIEGNSHLMKGLVFAPNADVVMAGSSSVVGAVVSKTFNGGDSGIPLEYQPVALSDFPIPIGETEVGDEGNQYSKIWFD